MEIHTVQLNSGLMSSCRADALYNFSKASSRDEHVFACARPGAKAARCYDPEDKVTEAEVFEWAAFIKDRGIKRVISLLTELSPSQTHVFFRS